jgi:3',5'-nucleoside bisphosphate phosphatase
MKPVSLPLPSGWPSVFGLAVILAFAPINAHAHLRVRTPVNIPDIPGYLTLKCDFHTHTVFSDGSVWPHIRSEEAWREGLDAVAITDHIEYLPHKADLPPAHNRSFEIAKPRGDELAVIVIRGSEITRQMPPGHLNAIFLDDVEPLDTPDWRDALQRAHAQGAFIFWNHPGWTGQQADGVARWYDEHTELLEQGRLHGIEVVNGRSYYPEAHRWCIEKNLAMLSNSDIHNPLNLDYDVHQGDLRPMTLVFARERTAASIKEALFDRRTAVYADDRLIGDQRFLQPIFERSVEIVNPSIRVRGRQRVYVQIHNRSGIPYLLERAADVDLVSVPETITLRAGRTVLLELRGKDAASPGQHQVRLPYHVQNLLVEPDTPMRIDLPLDVTIIAP